MATTTATKPAVAAKASKTARAKKMSPRSNRSLDRPVPGTMTAAKGGAPSPTATAAATPTIATKQPTAAQAKASDIRRYRDLANSFKLLADGTRLGILDMIAGGPKNVGDLCTRIGQSQPAVSHHLSLMRHGRLVEATRDGKNNIYSLTERGRVLVSMMAVVEG